MKRLYEWEEFENDSNKYDEIEEMFWFFRFHRELEGFVDFLKSLNLTKEEYVKISRGFQDYGQCKYDEGSMDAERQNNY